MVNNIKILFVTSLIIPFAISDCNAGACAGIITGAIGATVGVAFGCAVPGVNVAVCVPAVAGATAAFTAAGAICGQCTKVDECKPDNTEAYDAACVSRLVHLIYLLSAA